MGRLAVVGGHSLLGSGFGEDAPRQAVATTFGTVEVRELPMTGRPVLLQRHGPVPYVPAHRVSHRAHAAALAALGCDRVLGLASVGSLRADWPVGTICCPHDFVALVPMESSFDDGRGHVVPGFDPLWREEVLRTWDRSAEASARDHGIYWQTSGPRFETAAEIAYLARSADLVGMTIGSECVAAVEHGLAYAAVCCVDNLANGLAARPLSMEELEVGKRANRATLLATLSAVVDTLRVGALRSMSLVVHHASSEGARVGVRVDGDRIGAIGPEVVPGVGDEVFDATGLALVPGLVNGHTHAAMVLMRGFGDDLGLAEWLETRIWPVEARLTADDVYWGTRLACLEMIRTGTVCFWDMYWHGPAAARAAHDSGMRAVSSAVVIDGLDPTRGRRERARVTDDLDAIAELGPRIRASLGPHAVYTVSRETLEWLASVAAERGVPVQIHCSETETEVRDCIAANGRRPVAYLDEVGILGPHAVLAHGVWLDDEELALVAARGASVVTNPVSNLKLAVGRVFPFVRARAAGVPVGLGTDGAASNNALDLLQDVKLFALLQKHVTGDPAALSAGEAWDVVTGARAPVLGGAPHLIAGAPADFLLVRLDAPELVPGDLIANLVYAASGSVVDTTVVAGRVLMRGGRIEGAAEVIAEATRAARRLGLHAPGGAGSQPCV